MSETFVEVLLPDEDRAKRYAAGLSAWHPVKRLFNGKSQWLGRDRHVYGFLKLFSEVYELYLRKAEAGNALRTMAPLTHAAVLDEQREFLRLFPNNIIFPQGKGPQGERLPALKWKLHKLHAEARASIIATTTSPAHQLVALHAFDLTVAMLVRAVRSS